MCTNMGGKRASENQKKFRPEPLGESPRAVQFEVQFSRMDTGDEYKKLVWVPKTQLTDEGHPSSWIEQQKQKDERAYVMAWYDKQGRRFGSGMTQKEKEYASKRQERFSAGQKSYNELVQQAKDMGIKGVRVGMKRKTIEEKIRKHKK